MRSLRSATNPSLGQTSNIEVSRIRAADTEKTERV